LLISISTESGVTVTPGRLGMRSMRPSTCAEMKRTAESIGTRVPEPRTWRSIEPRWTVSIQTVWRSTVGAAGFSFDRPRVISPMASTAPMAMKMLRRRRFSTCPVRTMSIEKPLSLLPLRSSCATVSRQAYVIANTALPAGVPETAGAAACPFAGRAVPLTDRPGPAC
jgi:hypothetical protein